jgi:hypothetical protein
MKNNFSRQWRGRFMPGRHFILISTPLTGGFYLKSQMNLSEVFLCGKPFPYYPKFITQENISINACILLCYVGWRAYEDDPFAWWDCSVSDITTATGLSKKEQATAKAALVERKFIEERYARLDHKLQFRLGAYFDNSMLPTVTRAGAFGEHAPRGQVTQSNQAKCPKGTSSNGNNIDHKQYKNNTGILATTSRDKWACPISTVLPTALNCDDFKRAWTEWLTDRKHRGKPVTAHAATLQLKKLESFGLASAIESLNNSMMNGWAGVFDPRNVGNKSNGNNRKHGQIEEGLHAPILNYKNIHLINT